jgi:NAD-dependent dihydropyrimidine dehydrogenase PreA subunit
MCDWCEQYGDGYERWYFNPANYARRLYKIRKEEAEAAGAEANPQAAGGMGLMGREFVEAMDSGDHEAVERMKREGEELSWRTHFGQVITLDEALRVIDLMYPISVISCACRRSMQGLPDEENFTCIGMGPGMYKWERWPDTYRGGVQFLTPDEAKEVVTKMNKRGLVQCIYTFGTPYIGGLCNCDYPDCGGIRLRVDYDVKVLWKGHYVAQVDPELCNGCASCIHRCQFKALNFVPTRNKAHIEATECFGCGLCVTECDQDAITLVERSSLPALVNEW